MVLKAGKYVRNAGLAAAIAAAVLLLTGAKKAESGVAVGNVVWATKNVGRSGRFVSRIEDYGNYYTFSEAQKACPKGWCLPTRSQVDSLLAFGTRSGIEWATVSGKNGMKFGNGEVTLFFPAAGNRSASRWTLAQAGSDGYYWIDTPSQKPTMPNKTILISPADILKTLPSNSGAWYLVLSSTTAGPGYGYRALGLTVRCVRE